MPTDSGLVAAWARRLSPLLETLVALDAALDDVLGLALGQVSLTPLTPPSRVFTRFKSVDEAAEEARAAGA
jgi:hypothetical protein